MCAGDDIRDRVITRCRELGFALAGVCEARPPEHADAYLRWLDRGQQGEMAYMARNQALRIDPRMLLPGAVSIVCVADRYAAQTKHHASQRMNRSHGPRGKIARYARGDDYHTVMKKRLHELADELRRMFPDETFRVCVDTAPVLEREHAQRAGIGAIGKNTMLIERGVGSYLLLGEILTTLALPASTGAEPDPCGSCTRCIDACPTDAITPWVVDATRCISYLTIEHRSTIDPHFHEAMGSWIFGCDICQEVCPHNQQTRQTRRAGHHTAYESRRDSFDLLEVLNWSEDDRRQAFQRSPMKRARLDMMKRNALICAGNAVRTRDDSEETTRLRSAIEAMSREPGAAPMVQATARDVLESLRST